jgi:hypothetical protein
LMCRCNELTYPSKLHVCVCMCVCDNKSDKNDDDEEEEEEQEEDGLLKTDIKRSSRHPNPETGGSVVSLIAQIPFSFSHKFSHCFRLLLPFAAAANEY